VLCNWIIFRPWLVQKQTVSQFTDNLECAFALASILPRLQDICMDCQYQPATELSCPLHWHRASMWSSFTRA
jgi:hypothetical protein